MAETPQQLRVFVSHSHQDNDFCHAIVRALREAGADVWYDEHDMGWGQLKDEIIRELGKRPIFVLILSKAVFASKWVKRETDWAEELADRDPSRVILPVTAGPIERSDFGTENGWLFLHGYKRIEAPGFQPFPVDDAAHRLLRALALTPAGEAPAPVAPQPTEDVDDLLIRGKALTAYGKFADALPFVQRVTELTPGSIGAWVTLGVAFLGLGRWPEALDSFDQILTLDPSFAMAWIGKGLAYESLKRHDVALAAYVRALILDPNNATTWYRKARVLYELGRDDEAAEAEQRATELDERNKQE